MMNDNHAESPRGRWYCLLLLTTVLSVGCGDAEPGYVVVQGRVLYNGAPVPTGEIRFVPIEGTKGPTSGSQINQGEYRVDTRGGVPAGRHRVVIHGFLVEEPADVDDAPDAGARTESPEVIPDRYNKQSKLELTVPAGSEPIIKNFELTD